jgi:predicted 3-demethylubiquinone-9 3-methyltransferase (glyoxalase superfamily)
MTSIHSMIVTTLVMIGVASAASHGQVVRQPEKPGDSTPPPAREGSLEPKAVREPGRQSAVGDSKQERNPLPRVTTLLMFYGKAEEAMTLYTAVIPNSKITSIERYGKGEAGAEGSVKYATFTLNGQEVMSIDSPPHNFTFTPATSLFVTCKSEAEIDALFAKLSKDGKFFMPLQAYPFAKKFAWFTDRFGVSWQLNWPHNPPL